MFSKFCVFALVVFSFNFAGATDYIHSTKIKIENDLYGELQVSLEKHGTYLAIIRKLQGQFNGGGGNGIILCESTRRGYWDMTKGDLVLWGLGKANFVTCAGSQPCLELSIGKGIPVVAEQKVTLEPLISGSIQVIENLPTCQ